MHHARDVAERVGRALGCPPPTLERLHGGCVGQVYRARAAGGLDVVVKVEPEDASGLTIEALMLRYLRAHSRLPVPEVLFADDGLLVMRYIHAGEPITGRTERHAAELLADLHSLTADRFGFEQDTRIGGLNQPNRWTASWTEFFGRYRLEAMAREAERAGRCSAALRRRVERLADTLDRFISERARPGLIHGDVWSGNVLVRDGRVAAFVDPAIYYADPEVELAFITLFGTFGDAFFERYAELRPIADGFFELRRDVYNIYPLLVHVRLFGGGYVASVDGLLRRLGY